jgi:hypothetical protein
MHACTHTCARTLVTFINSYLRLLGGRICDTAVLGCWRRGRAERKEQPGDKAPSKCIDYLANCVITALGQEADGQEQAHKPADSITHKTHSIESACS